MEGGRWRHGDPVGFLKGPETTGFKLSPCVKLGRRRKAAEKREKEPHRLSGHDTEQPVRFFSKIFQFPGETLEPKRSPHTYFGESVDVSLPFQVPKERLWKNLCVKDA